jgi:septum site-determining protein MinD
MANTIVVHSFRRGAGKSILAANLAGLLAAEGKRIGLVDANLQSPTLHLPLQMDENQTRYWLNDFLMGKCEMDQVVLDVTPQGVAEKDGKIYLAPANTSLSEISRVLREGYDINLLGDAFNNLKKSFRLDGLVVDTSAGLNQETLVLIALADILMVVLRPDQQDYQGTAVTVDVAKSLEVPRLLLVANMVPSRYEPRDVTASLEKTYTCEIGAVIPITEEIMELASGDIFALRYPQHVVTATFRKLANKLLV